MQPVMQSFIIVVVVVVVVVVVWCLVPGITLHNTGTVVLQYSSYLVQLLYCCTTVCRSSPQTITPWSPTITPGTWQSRFYILHPSIRSNKEDKIPQRTLHSRRTIDIIHGMTASCIRYPHGGTKAQENTKT